MIQPRLALRFGEGACAPSPGRENFSSSAIRSAPFPWNLRQARRVRRRSRKTSAAEWRPHAGESDALRRAPPAGLAAGPSTAPPNAHIMRPHKRARLVPPWGKLRVYPGESVVGGADSYRLTLRGRSINCQVWPPRASSFKCRRIAPWLAAAPLRHPRRPQTAPETQKTPPRACRDGVFIRR